MMARIRAPHALLLLLACFLAWPVTADERAEHFEGKSSATVSQALANLAEYNHRLELLLEKDSLTALELSQVHELTYTLENALARLDAELERSAEALERVHLASEENDTRVVREQGQAYLQTITSILNP